MPNTFLSSIHKLKCYASLPLVDIVSAQYVNSDYMSDQHLWPPVASAFDFETWGNELIIMEPLRISRCF